MQTTDANLWIAIFACVSLLLQVFIGAFFYGKLTQTVRSNREMADQNFATLRNELMDLRQDFKTLSKRIYIRDFRSNPSANS